MLAASVLGTIEELQVPKAGSPHKSSPASKLDILAYLENKSKRDAASLSTQRALKNKANFEVDFLNRQLSIDGYQDPKDIPLAVKTAKRQPLKAQAFKYAKLIPLQERYGSKKKAILELENEQQL